MRGLRHAWLLLAIGACRDLTLPPAPAAGEKGVVFGRVVHQAPGAPSPEPAAGASVSLSASSLGVLAGSDGAFKIDGIASDQGTLLFQYDSDGDGRYDLQRSVRLQDIGAGPLRVVNLGDVSVSQNARLHGRVTRGDRLTAGGHVGTLVFVPESSFSTYCSDDGRYALSELPPGPAELAFFRSGYLPTSLSGLDLRPAEDFSVDDVALQPDDGGSQPGSIEGTVSRVPSGPLDQVTAAAIDVASGASTSGTVGTDGALKVPSLHAGLYDLRVALSGQGAVVVPNVPVYPGRATQLAVVLGSESFDGGTRPPAPDGGVSCGSTADCTTLQWCDDGFCRPQCGSSAQCTNGRVCDLGTRTCVVPCSQSCISGEACDPVSETCRAVCDGSRPCPLGQQCSPNSVCVPQCMVRGDCPGIHSTCQAGQCVSDGTCDTDLDCGSSSLCVALTCQPRLTTPTDAGWSCTQACDCRLDESCDGTQCIPAPLPAVLLENDAGSDLTATLAAATPGELIALRAGDTFTAPAPLVLAQNGLAITGGYVHCGTNRDVYDHTRVSTVVVDAGVAFSVPGTANVPIDGVALRGLSVVTTPGADCPLAAVSATFAPNLSLVYLSGNVAGWPGSSACSTPASFIRCSNCDGFYVDTVALPAAPPAIDWQGIHLDLGGGAIRAVTSPDSASTAPTMCEAINVSNLDQPLELASLDLGATAAPGSNWGTIDVGTCGTNPLEIHDSTISSPVNTQGSGHAAAIYVSDCFAASIHDNLLDGDRDPFTSGNSFMSGITAVNSGGSIVANTIKLPKGNSATAPYAFGIWLKGPAGVFDVRNDVISGGSDFNLTDGILLDTIVSGPLTLTDLDSEPATTYGYGAGLKAIGVAASTGLVVSHSTFKGPGDLYQSMGVWFESSTGRFERVKAIGAPDQGTGFYMTGTAQAEIYSSYILGLGSLTNGLQVDGNAVVRAQGNTIETIGTNTAAVQCNTGTVEFDSNLIGGGAGSPGKTAILYDNSNTQPGPCYDPMLWRNNYLWYGAAVVPYPADRQVNIATADAGVPDVRGNIFGGTTGCYGYNPVNPSYVLPSGSACRDRGSAPVRLDGTPVTLDLDGNPRTLGAAPDIGAFEKE
ncbi:MAG: carboxypeptidase-like regulatory domain-containing protein [Myxococcaceae bacterium]